MLAWAIPILIVGILYSHAFAQEDGTLDITAPPDIIKEATGYLTSVEIGMANASGSTSEIEITNNAFGAFPVGETLVHWLAIDEAGNRADTVQKITITDTTPPYFVDLPKYKIFTTDSPKKAAVDLGLPNAKDLADIDVDVSSSYKMGKKLPVGNTTVTFTARDDSGNTVTEELEVVLVDTSPKIQNLGIKVHSPTRVTITWDHLDGHASYKIILANLDTGKNVVNERSSGTLKAITGLEPDTRYTVTVSAADDSRTKVTSQFSTQPLAIISDDFSDLDGWTLKKTTTGSGWPRVHNSYMMTTDTTTGMPAPSAKLYGDGYSAWAWLEKDFDVSQFGNGTIYISIDYRAQSKHPASIITNTHFRIDHSNGRDLVATWLVYGGTRDTGWRQYSTTIDSLDGTDTLKVKMSLVDSWAANYRQIVNYDNLYIGTAPYYDQPIIRGGSGDEPPKDVEDEILERILAGDHDPYQYEDGVRLDNPYNDLVDSLLRLSNVTVPE